MLGLSSVAMAAMSPRARTALPCLLVLASCGVAARQTSPTISPASRQLAGVEPGIDGHVRLDSTSRGSPPDAQGGVATQEMSDEALGRLILELYEDTGDFPSDNFVSNETSFLHVAPALLDPAITGRAYIGVGPEQNLTYIALVQPRIAYIVDIRRENMLQHLVFRALVEGSETREAFLSRLTSRPAAVEDVAVPADAPIDQICDRVSSRASDAAVLAANEESAVALIARLGLPL